MNMKHFVAIIVGVSFLLGGFAMVGMATADHEGLHTCPVAQMLGSDCSVAGGVPLALHHIDGLLSLVEALPLAAVLLLFTILTLAPLLLLNQRKLLLQLHRCFHLSQTSFLYEIPILQIPLRWAALHNKRGLVLVL